MKKSFIGYDIKQTDELIESLQNQNDLLTAKITDLTIKLNLANESIAQTEPAKEALEQAESLKEQVLRLEEENRNYRSQCDMQLKKLEQLHQYNQQQASTPAAPAQSHVQNTDMSQEMAAGVVGAICERAYKDMEQMKWQTAQEMHRHVDEYTDLVSESNEKMKTAIADIRQMFAASVDQIASIVNDMYEDFKTIEESSQTIEIGMLSTAEVAQELKEKVDSFTTKVTAQNPQETAKPQQLTDNFHSAMSRLSKITNEIPSGAKEETSAAPSPQSSPCAAPSPAPQPEIFAPQNKPKTLGISSNVKPSDILDA